MKHFTVAFLFLASLAIAASPRQLTSPRDEGYYAGDAARMEKSIHPHYLKHVISVSDGRLRMTEKTGLQMVQDVRQNGPADQPKSEQKEEITVFEVANDMASVKLVTPHWTDYMTLAKWNGEWKIVSVVLEE